MIASRGPGGDRRGFALLAVLWIVTGITLVAMAATLAARDAVDTTRNRAALASARWIAAGCLERARASAAAMLRATERRSPGEGAWAGLDTAILTGAGSECTVHLRAAGDAVDVNEVDGDGLLHALLAAGIDSLRVEGLRDALLDWRDADTLMRARGAEHAWYVATGRTPPRDAPLVVHAELARVRGFEDVALRVGFGIEAGRAVLARAPLPVLAALPGMSPLAAAQVIEARRRGVRIVNAAGIAAVLAPTERAALVARMPEFAARVAPEPDAWIVTVRAGAVAPVTSAERWVRSGARVAVVRRTVMP